MSGSDRHAVAVGASVGGLLAARALSPHFGRVTLVERDVLPAEPRQRKGVPQGWHAHALLAGGRDALERLFPGFGDELRARGAVAGDLSRARWFDHGGYHARCEGIEGLLASRPLVEAQVRARVSALPNVVLMEGGAVRALAQAPGGGVAGVDVEWAGGERVLHADLVVDAGGRGSRSPAWLEALGYPSPAVERVEVGLGYGSRVYRRRPDQLDGDLAALIFPAPPGRRGGVALALEDDRWIVTLIGLLGDHPPREPDGFAAFARSLPAPDIHQLMHEAEPLTDIRSIRFPASTRRRYERLARLPEGWLAFGDAVCSFNPVYGQGMSVAALQAEALDLALAGGTTGLARRFFADAARALDTPWRIAVGGDLRYPEVEGPRSPMVRLINWYLGKLHLAARRDPSLTLAFQRVAQLLRDPGTLLRPGVAVRVLRGNLGRATR